MLKRIAILMFSLSSFGVIAEDRLVLITGCGRSGTTYISKALCLSGLDVPHEKLGEDGAVSWYRAGDNCYFRWKRIKKIAEEEYRHIFHQVRDPLKTIASAQTLRKEAWEYICQCVPEISMDDPLVVRCAKYWYFWNLRAEEMAEWTYRIEDIDEQFSEMGNRLGVPLDPQVLLKVSQEQRSRKNNYTPLTWNDLETNLEPELFENIINLANHYGY